MREMKISSSKPKSSPGRTEKFPPPLMRFLRSNVGSKSSRRSRASPMFLRGKNKNTVPGATAAAEPSSPKVTCIGQVRARRSKTTKCSDHRDRRRFRFRHCWWDKGLISLFSHLKVKKILPRSSTSCFRFRKFQKMKLHESIIGCHCHCHCHCQWVKNVLCFPFVCCRKKAGVRDKDSASSLPESAEKASANRDSVAGGDEEEGNRVSVSVRLSVSDSPPKNAFLLTRCRSAPYRSSSLASKFWETPLTAEETKSVTVTVTEEVEEEQTEDQTKQKPEDRDDEVGEIEKPNSSIGEREELQGSINGRRIEATDEEKVEDINGGEEKGEEEIKATATAAALHRPPLILTRCKSVPARTGDKLLGNLM